jgi:glucuronate isomerase
MRTFLDDNFLLKNETAIKLYHDYAKDAPIYDYHCHLSAQEIAEDKRYDSITDVWLGGDHYKWRVMRSNGVPEELITGSDTDDYTKFLEFAKAVPYTIGNPMYHWTHLELKRYFGIDDCLSESNAKEIYEKTNEILKGADFSARGLIKSSKVEAICTTDDPIDSLEYHIQLAEDDTFETIVLPTFRPDKGINIHLETFKPWLASLAEVVGYPIDSLTTLLRALEQRIDFFHQVGCRLSDHALDVVQYQSQVVDGLLDYSIAESVFNKAISDEALTESEITAYKSILMQFLGKQYAKREWVMQIHIGALRNNSKRMYNSIGADTGFDSINDTVFAEPLSNLLDDLDSTDELPKTILYVLNPRDNYVIGTMIGNFQGGGIPGKIQFGSGWWFCDQKEGMIDQMKSLSSLGLLSRFVGMLTDSRSFLSYTRHEYFRRILCNLIGEWVEDGEYPNDIEFLGQVVEDICINNARNYFKL